MRNLLLTAFLLSVFFTAATAQKPTVAYSAGFEEPTSGWKKVMQLKNGNTFYFHFTPKEGIDVTVYDPAHKPIARQTIISDLWDAKKMLSSGMEGIYEIGGQPVIFLQQVVDKTASLYRIKLNAQTGAADGEKLVASIPRYKGGSAWAIAYGGVAPNDFYVVKDPVSDEYAVVSFNSFAPESDQRILLTHYGLTDGKHKVLNKAYYTLPNAQYKYLNYVAMTLHNSTAYLCTYAYNSKWSANDAKLIVSKITPGDKSFTHQSLDFTEDFRSTKASLQYNTGTDQLQLLSLTLISGKWNANYYMPLITRLNPKQLKMIGITRLAGKKVDADMQRQMPRKDAYNGLPQQMVINKDYSTTIISEEMLMTETRSSYGGSTTQRTTLGSIGVSELDKNMEEVSGNVVMKSQVCNGLFEPMYISEKGRGKWSVGGWGFFDVNAFMSFDYVTTDADRYVIFNDYTTNFEKRHNAGESRSSVNNTSRTNTFCYKLTEGKTTAFYLFGKPADEKDTKYENTESSSYDAATKTYVTLMVEKTGKVKTAHIAWVTFP